ncbi:MAG TPA: tripartite tricarboxylate transporter substrate binding protein [Xanthobacteraceae bacterium]|jgi:tripartite-type tricarboxylate transporter receptor subunit TctC|nr:tripartite tricarboxylate transporter substrate binding protein [Xanthobacteraceae bacterium]
MRHAIGAAFLLACATSSAALAADYPTRPIRLIVGFAAGSSADVTARTIGQGMSEVLGQTIVVENRPGASSMVAGEFVSRAPKDGYTLLMATVASTINTTLLPDNKIDFQRDLVPITAVGGIPNILVVNPSVPAKNVQELIALAKAKPGDLLYGASGLGSGPQMATELFKQMAGIDMGSVLYPGSAQTVTDLLAGRIQVFFAPSTTAMSFVNQGMLRALATTQAKRMSTLPDLPTIAESGLPGYEATLWFGVLGPAGLDKAIVDKLSDAINASLKNPKVAAELKTQGLETIGGTPDQFKTLIATETERWAKVVHVMQANEKNK